MPEAYEIPADVRAVLRSIANAGCEINSANEVERRGLLQDAALNAIIRALPPAIANNFATRAQQDLNRTGNVETTGERQALVVAIARELNRAQLLDDNAANDRLGQLSPTTIRTEACTILEKIGGARCSI